MYGESYIYIHGERDLANRSVRCTVHRRENALHILTECVVWCVAESGTLSRNISSRLAHAARGCRCCGSLDGTCLTSPSIGSETISGHSSDRKGRLRRVSKVPKPSSSRTLFSTGPPRSPTSSPPPPSLPPPPPPSPPPPLRVEVVVVLRAVRTVPASSVKSGSCHSK